jgi:large subunit ribosomal protein L29
MTSDEVRALQTPEIESRLEDAREELFKLRFQFRTGQMTDYSRLRTTRRLIARLATILRERQIAAQLAARKEN